MNRFWAVDGVVCHRHFNQRVERIFGVYEVLPVGELLPQVGLAFGRGVGDFASGLIAKRHAGSLAYVHRATFDGAAHFDHGVGRQGALSECLDVHRIDIQVLCVE